MQRCLTPGDPYSLAPPRAISNGEMSNGEISNGEMSNGDALENADQRAPSNVLFLLGDSHATMYMPMLASALVDERLSLVFATMGSGAA